MFETFDAATCKIMLHLMYILFFTLHVKIFGINTFVAIHVIVSFRSYFFPLSITLCQVCVVKNFKLSQLLLKKDGLLFMGDIQINNQL